MTYTPMQNLEEFHDKFDRDGKARHARAISISLLDKRESLIEEEYKELVYEIDYLRHITNYPEEYTEELVVSAIAQLAKEMADLLYVVYGTAEELKIPLEEVFNEVHRSNMGKVWSDGTVHYNEYGKVLKPDTYSPPDIEAVLEREKRRRATSSHPSMAGRELDIPWRSGLPA